MRTPRAWVVFSDGYVHAIYDTGREAHDEVMALRRRGCQAGRMKCEDRLHAEEFAAWHDHWQDERAAARRAERFNPMNIGWA